MSALQRLAGLLVGVAIVGHAGCSMSPGVTFVASRCENRREGSRLKELAVISTLTANQLQGEQLIYQVRLLDRDRRPLRSHDGTYQTADGSVAANTSLVVLQSPQTFKDVRVAIPARELGVPPNRMPVLAEITLLKATGETVARVWRTIPAIKLAEVIPPMSAPAPVPYWFVRIAAPNRLPVMLGPYTSEKEAQAAVTEEMEAPKQVYSDEYLWFVPFFGPGDNTVLVGPCATEADAREILGLSAGLKDLSEKGYVAGAPVQVQVRQWLKEWEMKQALQGRYQETRVACRANLY